MDTIIIKSKQKSTSVFILEMAKRIRVNARILTEDEIEDLRLNQLLSEDEKNLEEIDEEAVYKTLRSYGAKI
ncbi:MAG: hypothetical protein HY958_08035 [Bacteroidia bacterium]|nr:hypothetical protein [Bacteroidia bacterium]